MGGQRCRRFIRISFLAKLSISLNLSLWDDSRLHSVGLLGVDSVGVDASNVLLYLKSFI